MKIPTGIIFILRRQTARCRAAAVLTLAAWLCSAGVTRSQPQATRWHRYSCVGLEVDLPDDWQAEDDDPWSFYKKPDGPSILFSPWIPLSWGTYRGVFERWLEGLPNPLPRTVKRLKVSGFEAVSLPVDTRGRGTPLRDTWIGVPENDTAHGRVYFFNLMAARAHAEEGQMVYEKMLASMRLDAKILHERVGPNPGDCSR